MSATRTVFWLALLAGIVPFLAVPEWLVQTVVAVFAVAIMITARVSHFSSREFEPPQIDDQGNNNSQAAPASTKNQDADVTDDKQTDTDNNPVDVTDPDADRMMASDQWRRRASRDIGDSNS